MAISPSSGKIKSNSGRVGKTAFIHHQGVETEDELKEITQRVRNIAGTKMFSLTNFPL